MGGGEGEGGGGGEGEGATMILPSQQPCKQCPFRRTSLRGWLGDSTPDEFLDAVLSDNEMPCHSTVDYSDSLWKAKLDAKNSKARFCAGALVFCANISKLSRDRERPTREKDKKTVFASPREFREHHHDWQNGEKPKL